MLLLCSGCVVIPVADLLRGPPLEEQWVEEGEGVFSKDKIALIEVDGVITAEEGMELLGAGESTVAEVRARLKRVERDPEVRAVVLRISSPGGEVTACDVIRHLLIELKKKRRLPVVASIADTGASGGYYIAAAADTIIAQPTAVIGSLGVILQSINVAGLFNKIGVEMVTVESSELKDLGSPFRPVTEEELGVLKKVVDNLYQRFIDVVDEGRPALSRDQVAALADGRVHAAAGALELGLIDKVGYLEDAIEEARSRAGIASPTLIRYTRAGGRPGSLYMAAGSPVSPGDGVTIQLRAGSKPRARFLYLWRP